MGLFRSDLECANGALSAVRHRTRPPRPGSAKERDMVLQLLRLALEELLEKAPDDQEREQVRGWMATAEQAVDAAIDAARSSRPSHRRARRT